MSTRTERRLLGATLISGVLVLFAHTGGPVSCSQKQMVIRNATHLFDEARAFHPSLQPGLLLTRRDGERASLLAGTVIELNGDTKRPLTLVGFDPVTRDLVISSDNKHPLKVPRADVGSVTVVGTAAKGANVGVGMLIGGVAGLGVGGAVAAGSGAKEGEVGCALVLSGLGGAGVGAGVGAAATPSSSKPRKEYRIEPGEWTIGEQPPKPAATPTTSSTAEPAATPASSSTAEPAPSASVDTTL